MEDATRALNNFSGFLDGFQARNLALIERDVALPLSQIQTRLRQLQNIAKLSGDEAGERLASDAKKADDSLRSQEGTIVSRLADTAQSLERLLVEHAAVIRGKTDYAHQLRAIVRLVLETAEISRSDHLREKAVRLAETFAAEDVK